jgi:hypothetical protein
MGIYKAVEFNTQTKLIDIVPFFDPSLVFPNTVAPANQNLAAGALVSLVNVGGVTKVINAFALNGSIAPAIGFVLTPVLVGQPATVFTVGYYIEPGSFVIGNVGQIVYLSTTVPGQVTLTAPTLPDLIQLVGVIVAVDISGSATISWSFDQAIVSALDLYGSGPYGSGFYGGSGGGSSGGGNPPTILSGSADAINPHMTAKYLVTTVGVDSMTIAAPTIGTDDGVTISITNGSSASHTVTFTGGTLRSGAAGVTTATFAAFSGSSFTFYAYQGVWYVLSQNLMASYS